MINANTNTWVRIRKSSVWTDWKQIATTTHITGLNDKITILDGVGFKYNGNITTFSQINKTGYYTIFGCSDGTIPIQYGTLKAYLSGSEKTITAMGWYNNEIIQCFASYNNNTSKWTWQQIATTDSVKQLNNVSNFNTGNTTPKDYLNVMKPNGARTYNDLGISVNDGYWCNVFGINNYNGDTGVTELAFTDKGKIFFRTQVGVAKMENWNDTHWQKLATTTKTDILVTPTNGLKVTGNNVSFVEEVASIKIYHGELLAEAPIEGNPIVLTLPKFTSSTWRAVQFLNSRTKEVYTGWCYHGGAVRVNLPAGQYVVDIIYT